MQGILKQRRQGTAAPQGLQLKEMPAAPTPPERPLAYSPADAASDPASESYKYMLARENYQQQLAEWQATSIQVQNENFQAREAHLRQQQQLQEQQRQQHQQEQQRLAAAQHARNHLYQDLTTKHRLPQHDAHNFMQWAQSKESLTDIEVWLNAWRIKTGQLRVTPVAGQTQQVPTHQRHPRKAGTSAAAPQPQQRQQVPDDMMQMLGNVFALENQKMPIYATST